MDSLEIRRGSRWPPVTLVLLTGIPTVILAWLGWSIARTAVKGFQNVDRAWSLGPGNFTVFVLAWLVVLGTYGALLWLMLPHLQLLVLGWSSDAVVHSFDASGMHVETAGAEVHVPWGSLSELRVTSRSGRRFMVRMAAPGPVRASRDPLARMLVRQFRKGRLNLRLTPVEPTEQELAEAIEHLSRGGCRLVD